MSTTPKFTEAKLEEAIIQLLGDQGYPYLRGSDIQRDPSDVLIRSDLRAFLTKRYAGDNITAGEIDAIIRQLDALNAADLYDSNKTVCKWVADGFLLKREDRSQKDLYVQLIDYPGPPVKRVPRSGEGCLPTTGIPRLIGTRSTKRSTSRQRTSRSTAKFN